MSGRTKERFAEEILEYFREMKESSLDQCRQALGITSRGSMNSAIARLVKTGALRCARSIGNKYALYEYIGEPGKQIGKMPELQHKAWTAMRISKTFTAWNIAHLSGASLEYVHDYIRSLKRDGILEKAGKDQRSKREILRIKKEYVTKIIAPRIWESTARREGPVQEGITLGWEMMRALRCGNTEKAKDLCVKILVVL